MANKTGVYPVFENKFKIGARGAAAKKHHRRYGNLYRCH